MIDRQIKRNVLWTLLIATVIFVFGLIMARAAAHSSGIISTVYRILLTPSMSVGLLESKVLRVKLSPLTALSLALVFHYASSFILISGLRKVWGRFMS